MLSPPLPTFAHASPAFKQDVVYDTAQTPEGRSGFLSCCMIRMALVIRRLDIPDGICIAQFNVVSMFTGIILYILHQSKRGYG